jgi:hypothetical protein
LLSVLLALAACGAAWATLTGGDSGILALVYLLPLLWIVSVVGNYRIGRFGPWSLALGVIPALSGVCAVTVIIGKSLAAYLWPV